MDIIVYRQVDVTGMSGDALAWFEAVNARMTPREHAPNCPGRNGAPCLSAALCFSSQISNVYSIDHLPVQRSPSDPPPPVIDCPDCKGSSPTQEEMRRQLAHKGDTSGACTTCDNTHVVAVAVAVAVCKACEFEAEHGTAEVPHPVHESVHTCVKLHVPLGDTGNTCRRCGRAGLSPEDGRMCSSCRNLCGND